MGRLGIIAALAALVAGGAFVYRRDCAFDRRLDALTQEVRALREQPPLPLVTAVATRNLDGEAIAAQVVERLRRDAPAPATAKPSEPEAAPPAATAAQMAALDSARSRVAAAVARGRLTRDDVLELRRQLAAVDPTERQEIRRQISVALNQQRLVPEDPQLIMP